MRKTCGWNEQVTVTFAGHDAVIMYACGEAPGSAGRQYVYLVIAILLGIAIAAWLVSYAAILVLYGHDRTATSGDGSAYGLTSS